MGQNGHLTSEWAYIAAHRASNKRNSPRTHRALETAHRQAAHRPATLTLPTDDRCLSCREPG